MSARDAFLAWFNCFYRSFRRRLFRNQEMMIFWHRFSFFKNIVNENQAAFRRQFCRQCVFFENAMSIDRCWFGFCSLCYLRPLNLSENIRKRNNKGEALVPKTSGVFVCTSYDSFCFLPSTTEVNPSVLSFSVALVNAREQLSLVLGRSWKVKISVAIFLHACRKFVAGKWAIYGF